VVVKRSIVVWKLLLLLAAQSRMLNAGRSKKEGERVYFIPAKMPRKPWGTKSTESQMPEVNVSKAFYKILPPLKKRTKLLSTMFVVPLPPQTLLLPAPMCFHLHSQISTTPHGKIQPPPNHLPNAGQFHLLLTLCSANLPDIAPVSVSGNDTVEETVATYVFFSARCN
jgi:hypothetical protein